MLKHGGTHIALLTGSDTCHLCEVLLSFLTDNVKSVVNGNDTDKPYFAVNDRQGYKAVLVYHSGNLFLTVGGMGVDYVFLHNLGDRLVLVGYKKSLGGNYTY